MNQKDVQVPACSEFVAPFEHTGIARVRIDGAEDLPPPFRRVRAQLFGVHTAPYWAVRVVQDLGGDRAQQERAERAIATGGHHDEVDLVLLRVRSDRLSGWAFVQDSGHAKAGEMGCGETVQRDLSFFAQPLGAYQCGPSRGLRGAKPGGRQVDDVQQDELTMKLLGHCLDSRDDGGALFGKVDRKKNSLEVNHREAPSVKRQSWSVSDQARDGVHDQQIVDVRDAWRTPRGTLGSFAFQPGLDVAG